MFIEMLSKVKIKNILIPIIAVFGFLTVWDIVFHGFLMEKIYLENSHLFRPQDEIQKNQNLMHLSNLIYASMFCFIYSIGYEEKGPIKQGIFYAIVVIALIWIPKWIHDYAIFPYTKVLILSGLVGHIIETISIGIITGFTYKEETLTQPPSLED